MFRDRAPQLEDSGVRRLPRRRRSEHVGGTRARGHGRCPARAEESHPRHVPRDLSALPQSESFDAVSTGRSTWTSKVSMLAFLYPSFGLFALRADDRVDARLAAAVACVPTTSGSPTTAAPAAGVCSRSRWSRCRTLTPPREAAYAVGRTRLPRRVRATQSGRRPQPRTTPRSTRCGRRSNELRCAARFARRRQAATCHSWVERFENLEQRHICSHPMEQMSSCRELGLRRCARTLPSAAALSSSKPDVVGCPSGSSEWTNTTRRGSSATTVHRPTLSMRPSEYFQRQCYVSADAEESIAWPT